MSSMYEIVRGLVFVPPSKDRFYKSLQAIYTRHAHGKRMKAKGGPREFGVDHWIKRVKRSMGKV